MKITPVSPIFPIRKNQKLNREDSENTANRQSLKDKKKKDFKKEFITRINTPDKLSISPLAQAMFDRRYLELIRNSDDWSGL